MRSFKILSLLALMLLSNIGFSATYFVDNNGDEADDNLAYTSGNGKNTFRKVIRLANNNPGKDTILFDLIPPSNIITLSAILPDIPEFFDPIYIDGGNIIEINQSGKIGVKFFSTASKSSSGSEVKNISIYNGWASNIIIDRRDVSINLSIENILFEGCYIGTDKLFASNKIVGIHGSNGILIDKASDIQIKNSFIMYNKHSGIRSTNGSSKLFITNNTISGNKENGIHTSNTQTVSILGNLIGVGANGITSIPNLGHGIQIESTPDVTIGGFILGERNIILNNEIFGVNVFNNSDNLKAYNNVVSGNGKIIAGIPTGGVGLAINVDCDNGEIKGNIIGLLSDGITPLENLSHGIQIETNSNNTTIGGVISADRNIISGNRGIGINLNGCLNTSIKGNHIGLGSDGESSLGNKSHGIEVRNCKNSIIGGSNAADRNIISSNGSIGINNINSPGTIIQGNYIGTSADGISAKGNVVHGIQVQGSREVIIGGDHETKGNIISGTTGAHGIIIDPSCNKSVIQGNYVGTDVTGKIGLGNNVIGIVLKSDSCLVGGFNEGEGNIISDSKLACGLLLADASNNIVVGNLIGTTADSTDLGNGGDGIIIRVEDNTKKAIKNIVQYNLIAYNVAYGIEIGKSTDPTPSTEEYSNNLRFNSIFCNEDGGINLNLNLSNDWGNNGIPSPIINTLLSTTSKIIGVPNGFTENDSIDIYEMIDCSNCTNAQGKKYIATIVANSLGAWSYESLEPLSGTLVAMVTDENKNSSQFSTCYTPCGVNALAAISETLIDLNKNGQKDITFNSTSTGNELSPLPLQHFWIINTADTLNAITTATSGNYSISSNPNGGVVDTLFLVVKQGACFDTAFFRITTFFIPNLVTPNGDNKNEVWKVSEDPTLFEAKIFNRWGDLIFWKDGYTDEWDASELNEGVYYYHLNSKIPSGKSYKGWVHVAR